MKKRYLAVMLLLFISSLVNVKALTFGNCEVLASYKLYSSLDEENYICKGKEYGSSIDAIYYSGSGSKITLNNFDAYYFTSYDNTNITLDVYGNNNISMFGVSSSKIKVTGTGSLKFRQNSFVKKLIKGKSVYRYVYKGKALLNESEKIYEGITEDFERNYETLKKYNKLPKKYNLEDYELIRVEDFEKMTSVVVTNKWVQQNINTNLTISLENGMGVVKYVKPLKKNEKKAPETTRDKDNKQLETDNVIFISNKEVNKKYELKEENLKDHDFAKSIEQNINKDLVSLYDVSVYNGNKQVSMKNGHYTIKIKLDSNVDKYENYQIIYVNDDGEIEEYIDGHIEGEYIKFETSHLSQYGVIANPKSDVVKTSNVSIINDTVIYRAKISILIFFITCAAMLIGELIVKNNDLSTSKRRKRA